MCSFIASEALTEKDIAILNHPHDPPYVDDLWKMLAELVNQFSPKDIGVEIGVLRAATSRYILDHTRIAHLHLIDPWKVYRQRGYYDILKERRRANALHGAVTKIMKDKNCTIHRGSIEEAIDSMPQLGFAFIDGNHSYEGVMNDLNNVVPKIKKNGLVCGHDWTSSYPEVVKSVTAYFVKNEQNFYPPSMFCEGLQFGHCPAPTKNPVVNKSWPKGHLWWAIKK